MAYIIEELKKCDEQTLEIFKNLTATKFEDKPNYSTLNKIIQDTYLSGITNIVDPETGKPGFLVLETESYSEQPSPESGSASSQNKRSILESLYTDTSETINSGSPTKKSQN